MSIAAPWLRVLGVVGAYVVIALASSVLVRRAGADLKELAGRTSRAVTLAGAAANLVVLGVVLLMTVLVDRQPVASPGFRLGVRDAAVLVGVLAVTAGLTWWFLVRLAVSGRSVVRRRQRPPAVRPDRAGAVLMVGSWPRSRSRTRCSTAGT